MKTRVERVAKLIVDGISEQLESYPHVGLESPIAARARKWVEDIIEKEFYSSKPYEGKDDD